MWPQSLYDSWHLTNKKSFKMLTPSTSLLLYNIRSQSCFTSGLLLSIFFLSGVALNVILFFFFFSSSFSAENKVSRAVFGANQKAEPNWALLILSGHYTYSTYSYSALSPFLLSTVPFIQNTVGVSKISQQWSLTRNLSNGPWPSQPSVHTLRGKRMGSTQNRMIAFTDCLPTPPF